MVRILLLLPMIAGCDGFLDGDTDTDESPFPVDTGDDDTDVEVACPEGLTVPADGSVSLNSMRINQLNTLATLGSVPHDGMPPLCASDDGYRVQALLVVAGEPFAWLRSTADGPVNEPMTIADVELDAFGYDPPTTWGSGDWFQGQRVVSARGAAIEHGIDGVAEADTRTVGLLVTVSVTP